MILIGCSDLHSVVELKKPGTYCQELNLLLIMVFSGLQKYKLWMKVVK